MRSGVDAPAVDGEPLAATAEPGHHLVGDHHDAVVVAQLTDALEVAVGRHEDAVRADHGLQHDGGDVLAALDHDHVGQVGERPLALLGVVGGVEGRAVGVGPPELDDAGQPRLAAPAAGIAGHRDRPGRRAVVAAVGREDLVPAGVQPGHADGVLGGLGAAVGEEHHVEVAGRQLADQPGGLAAGVVGVDRGDGAELVGLLLDRRHQLGVLVADVDVDELAGEVEVAVALLVPEPRPLGPGDDDRVERRLRRPRVEDVGAVVEVGLDRERVVASAVTDGPSRANKRCGSWSSRVFATAVTEQTGHCHCTNVRVYRATDG